MGYRLWSVHSRLCIRFSGRPSARGIAGLVANPDELEDEIFVGKSGTKAGKKERKRRKKAETEGRGAGAKW